MKTQSSLKNFLLLALLLPGVMGGYGCQKLKKLLTKPPPAGVTNDTGEESGSPPSDETSSGN